MKRIILTQKEIENKVEKALENACSCLESHHQKLAFVYFCEAQTYLEMLEDLDIWYDDCDTINEHVQNMLDIMQETKFEIIIR